MHSTRQTTSAVATQSRLDFAHHVDQRFRRHLEHTRVGGTDDSTAASVDVSAQLKSHEIVTAAATETSPEGQPNGLKPGKSSFRGVNCSAQIIESKLDVSPSSVCRQVVLKLLTGASSG